MINDLLDIVCYVESDEYFLLAAQLHKTSQI